MAQFWIAIFFILLAGAQLYQSAKDIDLPFPVYLVLGTVLAVAANSRYKFSFGESEQVTLQDIKAPAITDTTIPTPPQIAAAESKVLPATATVNVTKLPNLKPAESPTSASIQADENAPKKSSRPRKSTPKQSKKQP